MMIALYKMMTVKSTLIKKRTRKTLIKLQAAKKINNRMTKVPMTQLKTLLKKLVQLKTLLKKLLMLILKMKKILKPC